MGAVLGVEVAFPSLSQPWLHLTLAVARVPPGAIEVQAQLLSNCVVYIMDLGRSQVPLNVMVAKNVSYTTIMELTPMLARADGS